MDRLGTTPAVNRGSKIEIQRVNYTYSTAMKELSN